MYKFVLGWLCNTAILVCLYILVSRGAAFLEWSNPSDIGLLGAFCFIGMNLDYRLSQHKGNS